MSTLERVLREIEIATAIAARQPEDLEGARQALNRRQRAIGDLAKLGPTLEVLSPEERDDAVRRLRVVSEGAIAAERWLIAVKSDAMAEWKQWSHIYRALGASYTAKPSLVDCSG